MSYVKVAATTDIPAGKMKTVKVKDKEVLIANVNGKYYAIGGKCTHKGGDLSKGTLTDNIITCPRHKARFDVTTGKSVSGPKIPLSKQQLNPEPVYKVKVEGSDILVSIE
ncbi:MAG: non-heme iron oxygenase ferredoxin subunit [Candidatus Odinarchaeota archaeon]